MKFGNKAINNIFHSAEDLLEILNIGQESPIFPFEVVSGFVTETRTSARRDYTATDKSEETYRVFTGEETPLVRWEGSTRAYLANEDDKELKSEYKVGKILYGNILSQDFAQTFEQDTLGKDLKDWITGEAYVIKTSKWQIEQNDLYKLYIVTEKGNNKLLKIDTATNHYNESTGDWVFAELSLIAINLELEQTGTAIQQKIQFSAPGEGYAFPKIKPVLDGEGQNELEIILDSTKLINLPITSAQVSLWGTAPISSVTVIGRPIYDIIKKDNEEIYEGKIEQPRHLLMNKFLSPIDNALQTTGSMVNNYVMMLDAQLQLKTFFEDWKTQQESRYDENIKKTYEGVLTTEEVKTVATNPTDPVTSQFTHNLWNDYTIATGNAKLNTTLSGYFSVREIILEADMKVADIMNLASFINAQVEKLPMEITESIPFRAVSLPIIGGFLNHFVSGFGLGWASQDSWYNASTFTALFPAGQYDYITKAVYALKNGKGLIPIDIFNSDDETQASAIVGSNAVRTAIRFELTDRYTIDGGNEILNTKVIGQEVNGNKQVLNEKLRAEPRAITGYIPDMIIVDTPAKMNYTVAYFSGDQEIFRAIYQTKGKYFNNTREWKSINFHSHWFEETGKVVKGINTVYAKNPPGALASSLSHRISSPFGTAKLNVNNAGQGKEVVKYLINFSQFGITKDDLINKYSLILKGSETLSGTVVDSQLFSGTLKANANTGNVNIAINTITDQPTDIPTFTLSSTATSYVNGSSIPYYSFYGSAKFTVKDNDIELEITAIAGNGQPGTNPNFKANATLTLNLSEVDLIYKDSSDENK